MSQTIAIARGNVRALTGDTKLSDPVIGSNLMNQMLVEKSQQMAGVSLGGTSWQSGEFVTSAGNRDANSVSTDARQAVIEVKRQADGYRLRREAEAVVESFLDGVVGTSGRGKPEMYYLREDSTGVLTIRMYPIPDAAYTLDALVSSVPGGDITAITASIDETTVMPFGSLMCRAIEKAVAIQCIASMTAEDLAKVKRSKDVVTQWKEDVAELVRGERKRISNLRRTPFLAPGVW